MAHLGEGWCIQHWIQETHTGTHCCRLHEGMCLSELYLGQGMIWRGVLHLPKSWRPEGAAHKSDSEVCKHSGIQPTHTRSTYQFNINFIIQFKTYSLTQWPCNTRLATKNKQIYNSFYSLGRNNCFCHSNNIVKESDFYSLSTGNCGYAVLYLGTTRLYFRKSVRKRLH